MTWPIYNHHLYIAWAFLCVASVPGFVIGHALFFFELGLLEFFEDFKPFSYLNFAELVFAAVAAVCLLCFKAATLYRLLGWIVSVSLLLLEPPVSAKAIEVISGGVLEFYNDNGANWTALFPFKLYLALHVTWLVLQYPKVDGLSG